jgi:uncharacterized membrane protein SpoIIM required for sporulation/ABC-type transport system involved in multi-copper enzyme maturation permease subunit
MLNSLRPALIITRREVRDQLRDWRIIFPVLGLTLFFPFLMNFTAQQLLGFVQRYGADIIADRLVPFLLMVVGFFPISVSLVIALESFVGEKERGSIEPLLNTPLLDWQLYLGKLLAVTIPPLVYSFIGMGVYLVGLYVKDITLPDLPMLILILVLTAAQALMMVSGAVVVSSQATSIRSANLLASFIIIPAAFLIQGESVMMFWANYNMLWWVVVGVIILTILLVRVGLAHFAREELLGRELDVLNVRWILSTFKNTFTGGEHTLIGWYRHLFRTDLPKTSNAIWLVTGLAVAAIVVGVTQVPRFPVVFSADSLQGVNQRVQDLLQISQAGELRPVLMIFWQNLRVLLISMVLGILSLGVLGVLPFIASMGTTGYLVGTLAANGLPATTYLGLVVPHAILEVPAAILATAAVLRAGALLATPTPDRTVGEVWITSIATWCKLMVGLVVPLLLVASFVEAWVTPRLALLLLN